ncbi:NAD(P)-dependent oxidoreductase [Ruegeria sediminis]|nr:NAD(P)-binding domain-containing protein [Ruegeria sediminis]
MANVGFIGLGVMGAPMALNILKGGHSLSVFDLNPDAVQRLVEAGATACASPKEVGAASEIVVTMLPEPQHVHGAILGKDGVAEGLREGGIVIEMSTIDPQTSQTIGDDLRKRGMNLVDSPVGKTSEHAVTGTLTLMIGGEPDAITKVEPILDCMGNEKYYCGGPGMGHAMKITNNVLATTIMVANTEALALGLKCGLTLEMMQQVMRNTMAWNSQFSTAMPKKGFVGDDSPGFAIRLAAKDVRLACELEEKIGIEPRIGRAGLAALQAAIDAGYGDRDTARLMFMLEEKLGVEARQKPAMAKAS